MSGESSLRASVLQRKARRAEQRRRPLEAADGEERNMAFHLFIELSVVLFNQNLRERDRPAGLKVINKTAVEEEEEFFWGRRRP